MVANHAIESPFLEPCKVRVNPQKQVHVNEAVFWIVGNPGFYLHLAAFPGLRNLETLRVP